EARTAYLRAFALDPSLNEASFELAQFRWSQAHLSELRGMLASDVADPGLSVRADATSSDRYARNMQQTAPINPSARVIQDPILLDFIRFPSRPLTTERGTFDPNALSIHWVIPEFGAGGGGHMNIFRIVRWLE